MKGQITRFACFHYNELSRREAWEWKLLNCSFFLCNILIYQRLDSIFPIVWESSSVVVHNRVVICVTINRAIDQVSDSNACLQIPTIRSIRICALRVAFCEIALTTFSCRKIAINEWVSMMMTGRNCINISRTTTLPGDIFCQKM